MELHDHRMLAKRLDLYHVEEHSPGMIFWHPRGYRIYPLLEDFIRDRMRRLGYEEVHTPQLLARELWEKLGHWDKFRENMFSVSREDGRDMALKPMSCPCHVQIFNDAKSSWRDLPMRYAEFGQCHRDEPSGSLHGLMRTKAFAQDDAHVLCRPAQVQDEVRRFVGLLQEVYAALGFEDIEVALSLRPDKRSGADEQWDWAESELLESARKCGLDPKMQPGEGAYYGPKIEFALRDRMGRAWQCGTVQLDSVLPGRLGASYVNEDGKPVVPIMIHHAVFGSIGRFIGILLEENAGRLPLWLSPDQVAILPISESQHSAAKDLYDGLMASGLRPRMFGQSETLSRRIVAARELEVPVMAIIGEREASSGQVTLKIGDAQEVVAVSDVAAWLQHHVDQPPER